MTRLARITLILFLLANVTAFLIPEETKKENKPLFIRGGTVHTITRGVIQDGSILIQDGKIHKIGSNIIPPEEAVILEAGGKWVMPGFVVAQTSAIAVRPIIREDRNPKILNYLDPFSLELQLLQASGITAYSPNLGTVSPYALVREKSYNFKNAVIKPVYGELLSLLVKEPAYLYISIPSLPPSEKNELRDLFLRAREFLSKEAEYEKSKDVSSAKPPTLLPDLKLYVSVLKQEMPVRFLADNKKDILKVLSFVDEFEVRAQVYGAAEGWLLAEEIGRRNISTVIQPEEFLRADPYQPLPSGSNIRNAAIQNEKGVRFALINASPSASLGGMIGTNLLTFPLTGSYAIRGGLGMEDALAAITIRPAELLGMSHRMGSLEEGKDADIVILDGNPFDYRTYVEYTILNGKLAYDKSRSDLYKKIPKPKRMF